MQNESNELDEKNPNSLLSAIKFWLSSEISKEHSHKKYSDFKNAVEDYANSNKINVNRCHPPVIWLRLFFEVRSNYRKSQLPEIDPDAINLLLELEQDRQKQDKFLLYRYINSSTQKGRGPRQQRTPDRVFVGYSTMEILLMPKPTEFDPQSWPYHLDWKVVIQSRLKKGSRQKSDVEYYKLKWGKLTYLLEGHLKTELEHQKCRGEDIFLLPATGSSSKIYRSTITALTLAAYLSKQYSEIGSYALKSVLRVLSCYVSFPKGRPKKIIKEKEE